MEDCGGVSGYEQVLEALKPKPNEDQEELLKWLGGYDPEDFDLTSINRKLQPRASSRAG